MVGLLGGGREGCEVGRWFGGKLCAWFGMTGCFIDFVAYRTDWHSTYAMLILTELWYHELLVWMA